MFQRRNFNLINTIATFSLAIGISSSTLADTLRVGGTGVALGGMQVLGHAFQVKNPEHTIEILPSLGSSGGVRALVAGAIDLSVSSRALKSAEVEQGAIAQLYATTPLAVVTNAANDVKSISSDQLIEIYSGRQTHWSSGELIRIILRPESETDTKILKAASEGMAEAVEAAYARTGILTASNDQENAETLETIPGSLGLVAIGQIATEKRNLNILALDGQLPTAGVTPERHSAFLKSLYIVNTTDIKPLAADFLSYILSEDGQSLLSEFDHTPVK